jgi:hypothetical protein
VFLCRLIRNLDLCVRLAILSRSFAHARQGRFTSVSLVALACVALLAGSSAALTVTCGQPTAPNGFLTLTLEALGEVPCYVVVPGINNNMGPGLKAIHIRDAITAACGTSFAATVVPTGKVVITSGSGTPVVVHWTDYTGEKTGFNPSGGTGEIVIDGSVAATASGVSHGGGQGLVSIGTEEYLASVTTVPGQSTSAVLAAVHRELLNHGVKNIWLHGDSLLLEVTSPNQIVFSQIDDTGLDSISVAVNQVSDVVPTFYPGALLALAAGLAAMGGRVLRRKAV